MVSAIYLSAANKSSGKTTIALGLGASLKRRGIAVQPFKKGPDYIDPMWLSAGCGNPCFNLDFNTQGTDQILSTFNQHRSRKMFALVEGNKGLFDGLDLQGSDSNAALAKLLGIKVVLVMDVQGSVRGIAPLLKGYQDFDSAIAYAGVILNKTGGSRHEKKLRNVIDYYTDFNVLGVIHHDPGLVIPERHLGLTTDQEFSKAHHQVMQIADVVEAGVDVDKIIFHSRVSDVPAKAEFESGSPSAGRSNTNQDPVLARVSSSVSDSADSQIQSSRCPIKIGVARDRAFCFYYADDLLKLLEYGVELVYFDMLSDTSVPDVDGLFIGGGFPETHCLLLENNQSMKMSVAAFFRSGKPVYAECGGLMYLSRRILWKEKAYEMAGIIPGDVEVVEKPVGRGYVKLRATTYHPWKDYFWRGQQQINMFAKNSCLNAHEFHYSRLVNMDQTLDYAYKVERGWGIDGDRDGIVLDNLLASYSHLRHTDDTPWIHHFLGFVESLKSRHPASLYPSPLTVSK